MFRVNVFGSVSLEGPDGPVTGRASHRHRLALLALLSTARGGLRRERVATYLWPDVELEKARRLLSDSIYRVNHSVQANAIVSAGDELRLDSRFLTSDLEEFETALEAGQLERAVAVQAGPFLDGFHLPGAVEFDQWMEGERSRLARARQRALETLAEDADGDPRQAARWWRELSAADPYSSRIAMGLMRSLVAHGERAAALQHCEAYSNGVRNDLGLQPNPDILQYAETLKTWPDRAPTQGADEGARGPPGPDSKPGSEPPPRRQPIPRTAREGAVTHEHVGAATALRRFRRGAAYAAVALGAVAATAVVVGSRSRPVEGGDDRGVASIVVLPFADISQGRDQEYLADGITEELIGRLSNIDGLRVAGRTSAFAFKGSGLDVREIGAQLDVSTVLEGSVRQSGDRLRIDARLVDAEDGFELWAETFERQMVDVFAIQDEIASAIVDRLRGTAVGPPRTLTTAPVEPEAYNLYLSGRYEWHKRSEAGLLKAVDLFRDATERAPGYARAHAGLGDAYAVLAFYDYLPPAEAFPLAVASARRAIELDPTLAEPHATLGYAALYHEWDGEQAEIAFLRAIDLDPSYSTGRQWYANLLLAAGRFDESAVEMRVAQELDPLSLIANAALGFVWYQAGESQRALDQLRHALQLNDDFDPAHLWYGMTLEDLGRFEEAVLEYEKAVAASGSAISRAALARGLARAGREREARALVAQLEQESETGYVPAFEIAKVYEGLGEPDAAMIWLRRAFADRSHSMAFLAVDRQLARLRARQDFQQLVAEVPVATQASERAR